MSDPGAALRALAHGGQLDLPRPGQGRTAERHRALSELTRRNDVTVGRLAEAHTDAVAIRAEAGLPTAATSLYGVWASGGADETSMVVDRRSMTVGGARPFCSGLGIVDRALVTAVDTDGGVLLLDVAVSRASTLSWTLDGWSTPALRASNTGVVTFRDHPVEAIVGGPNWYLTRPGFWPGACGPAACWTGAAAGLVDVAPAFTGDDPLRRAELGAMRAIVWGMVAVLDQAGDQLDAGPGDAGVTRPLALAVRALVEAGCTGVLDRFSRAFGPRPFTTDEAVARRHADTHLYIRQHGGRRDELELGITDTAWCA